MCPAFLSLNVKEKYQKIIRQKKCVNCLKSGHLSRNCTAEKCKKCKKAHNTLLHDYYAQKVETTALLGTAVENDAFEHVFLATAIIEIKGKDEPQSRPEHYWILDPS